MDKLRLVAIGDSLTYGYPYPPSYSWVRRAADRLGIEIDNKGVCGETTADMRLRFVPDVVVSRPAWVVITGGSNDAFFGVRAAVVAANVQAMVDAARERGIKPMVGLPPPMSLPEEALLADYRQALAALANAAEAPLLDFYRPLLDAASGGIRDGLHTDGVHPNEDGYALMAEAAIAALRDILS